MSLYYEATEILTTLLNSQDKIADFREGSLRSLVFSSTSNPSSAIRKSNPTQVYALLIECSKWSLILKEVVERSGLLDHEKKLTPQLALLLTHDLLLAKRGIAAPASHPLRLAIERHKARLGADFVKARLRRGCANVEALRTLVEREAEVSSEGIDIGEDKVRRWSHPRWIRVNTLCTSMEEELGNTFASYSSASLSEVLTASSGAISAKSADIPKIHYQDIHVPNLLAFPAGIDVTKLQGYREGRLILQDKASCFPAYLLDYRPTEAENSGVLDACAAPGNKTSHLAALLKVHAESQAPSGDSRMPKIYACERDLARAMTLRRMMGVAGCDGRVRIGNGAQPKVEVLIGQDFLKLDPDIKPWRDVGAVLLDPSCSGSGIVERDAKSLHFVLPVKVEAPETTKTSRKRKRKGKDNGKGNNVGEDVAVNGHTPSKNMHGTISMAMAATTLAAENDTILENPPSDENLQARLASLAALQTKMLTHAFHFPSARRITYSTCSIYDDENENVVIAALSSPIAKERGWRAIRREEQVVGMRKWNIRGRLEVCLEACESSDIVGEIAKIKEIAEACIRCEKFTEEGTQGFFVVGFVRDVGEETQEEESESEWEGWDD